MDTNVTMVTMEVDVTQEDQDGSETMELYISDLPEGVTVPGAEHVTNTWKLVPEGEMVLFNMSVESGYLFPMSINMTLVSKETSNDDKYEYRENFNLELCSTVTESPEVTTPSDGNVTASPSGGNVTRSPDADVTRTPGGGNVTVSPGSNVTKSPGDVTGTPGGDATKSPW